jgi:ribosome-associated protein
LKTTSATATKTTASAAKATPAKATKKTTKGPVSTKRVTNSKLGTSSSQRSRSVAKVATSGSGSRKTRGQQPPEDRARVVALAIAEVGLENKALNVEIIDVRGKVDYSDYVVVMSGRSDRQVNALGRHIEEELKAKHSARCLGVEGMPSGTWLLMDFGDVVVHIFHEDTRGYYDLETLWIDAARVTTSANASDA